jgi:hypothetical protein
LRKFTLLLSVLFFCALHFMFAQETSSESVTYSVQEISGAKASENDENRGEGLVVSLDMAVDAFNTSIKSFEHPEIRGKEAQPHTETRFFISEWEFAKDANASIGYDSKYFGGNFAFQPQATGQNWTFGAKIRGWAQFAFLRVVLGNDIETLYADRQGSDEALAVYTSNTSGEWFWEDPDNITNSTGLLVRFFLDPLTIDLAAGDFDYKWESTPRIEGSTDENIYKDRYTTSFRYGARIGYEIGDIGKINASYKISQNKIATNFNLIGGDSSELVADRADAEAYEHVYGLYGSFYFNSLSFTLGYVGTLSVNLPEFYSRASGENKMVKTNIPIIPQNGIVFNAMWKGDQFTIRTDNGVTFWSDKNYEVFDVNQSVSWDYNLISEDRGKNFAFVEHFVMRNGLGLSFPFTNKLGGNIYLFNSLIQYSASGNTAGSDVARRTMEYIFWEDEVRLELGLTYTFNPNINVYIKLKVADTMVSRSLDLNQQTIGFFEDRVHFKTTEPVATMDSTFSVNIPIGISIQMR